MSEQKPRGYWKDEQNVLREVAAWRAEHGGEFPTFQSLQRTGNSSLSIAIVAHGGYRKLRDREGITQACRSDGYWEDFERVREAIEAWRATHGRFPTSDDLQITGHAALGVAISRHHGGYLAVRSKMGEALDRHPSGYWKDFENVRAIIEAFRSEHGHFPTSTDLERIPGTMSISGVIAIHHGGMNAVRARLGGEIIVKRAGHWKDFENVRVQLEEYLRVHGRLPTHRDLKRAKLNSISAAISTYHGGFPAVAARLGCGPITDETIAAHADALAQIVPSIGAPSALWSAMKARWTTRDLDAAIAAFETDGNLDRFAQLLTPSRE